MTAGPLPRRACPSCEALCDDATLIEDVSARPGIGDVTVCFYCHAVLIFGPELDLLHAPPELATSPEALRVVALLEQYKAAQS